MQRSHTSTPRAVSPIGTDSYAGTPRAVSPINMNNNTNDNNAGSQPTGGRRNSFDSTPNPLTPIEPNNTQLRAIVTNGTNGRPKSVRSGVLPRLSLVSPMRWSYLEVEDGDDEDEDEGLGEEDRLSRPVPSTRTPSAAPPYTSTDVLNPNPQGKRYEDLRSHPGKQAPAAGEEDLGQVPAAWLANQDYSGSDWPLREGEHIDSDDENTLRSPYMKQPPTAAWSQVSLSDSGYSDSEHGSTSKVWFRDHTYEGRPAWPHREGAAQENMSQPRSIWFASEPGDSEPPSRATTPEPEEEETKEEEKKDDNVDEKVYPGWKVSVPVMTSLYIILFLVALDGTIIATAVPSIVADFESPQDIGWYGSIYMMMRCAFVLVFGKLYTFYNPKWVLLTATIWFEAGSALCGAAPSSVAFIMGRWAQGVGAAGIFTGAMVAVKDLFPLQKRPIIMGFLGLTFTLSTVLGPLIGGILTDNLSWRWCFYINLPLGGVAVVMLLLLMNLPSPPGARKKLPLKAKLIKLDPIGFVTFVPAVVCLLLALEWGGSIYPWSDWRLIVLLTFFSVLFVLFVISQIWLQEGATVPPRIAKQRSIACAMWFSIMNGGAVTTVAYYLPLWFQAVKGSTPTDSGENVLPNAIATMIGSITCGILTSRIGYYVPFMISGPVFMAIGAGLLTTLSPTTAFGARVAYQIVYGLGAGGGGNQASVAAQTVLKDEDVAIGASLMMFTQMFGSALFTAVGQNVFATTLVKELMRLPGVDYTRIMDAGPTRIRSFLSGGELAQVVDTYNLAITSIFLVTVGLACSALLGTAGMEWVSVKKVKKTKAKKGKKGSENEKLTSDANTSEEGLVPKPKKKSRKASKLSQSTAAGDDDEDDQPLAAPRPGFALRAWGAAMAEASISKVSLVSFKKSRFQPHKEARENSEV